MSPWPLQWPQQAPSIVPVGTSLLLVTLTSIRADAISMATAVAAISLSTRSPSSSCLTSRPLGRRSWGQDGMKGTIQEHDSPSGGACHGLIPSR